MLVRYKKEKPSDVADDEEILGILVFSIYLFSFVYIWLFDNINITCRL